MELIEQEYNPAKFSNIKEEVSKGMHSILHEVNREEMEVSVFNFLVILERGFIL